jgi:hypothetical protein
MRNSLCFQERQRMGMSSVIGGCARTIRNWSLLLNPGEARELMLWAEELDRRSVRPPAITWEQLRGGALSGSGISESKE